MALPVSFVSETLADNTVKSNGSPEISTWSVPITTLNAGNLAATTTLINTLLATANALLLGQPQRDITIVKKLEISTSPASSVQAQRENKFLVRYHGDTLNQKFQVSLPTADLTQLVSGSEFVVITGGDGAAFKAAFEAVVVSPNDSSETVTLDSIQFVGRNT